MIRGLCIGIATLAVIEFVIATPLVQVRSLPTSTDFATYWLAGAQARDGVSPYDSEALAARGRAIGLTYDQFPFLYPPPFALAMQPLAALSYPRARQVWMGVTTCALLAALAACLALVRAQAAAVGLPGANVVFFIVAAFFASALNSTSVHNDIRAGSVGAILFLAATVIAWRCLDRANSPHRGRRDVGLATALGVAVLVKLVPAIWIVWVAWRGRWRAALWSVAGLGSAMAFAIACFGWDIVPSYVRDALWPSLQREVLPPMNQSLQAAFGLLGPTPLVGRILGILAAIALAVITVRELRHERHARPRFLLPIEFGYVVVTTLLLMKLTWVQTLCAMLFLWPVMMIVLSSAAAQRVPWARRAMVLACLGYFLSSAHVPILWAGLRQGPLVIVTAVHTIGLLILWGVAGFILRRAAALQGCAATATQNDAQG